MKINVVATDCVAVELLGGDVSVRKDGSVVALINPFKFVAELEKMEIGGLLFRGEWIFPEAENFVNEGVAFEKLMNMRR